MTEEIKQEAQTEETTKVSTTETPKEIQTDAQLSKAEEKALARGWKPKDQWDGDPDEWRDAQSFLDRGEFLKHISDQNKQIKELLAGQRAMAEHNRKLAEVALREQLTELRAQKKQALENNDADAIVEIEAKIDEVKDKVAETKAVEVREGAAGGVNLTPPPEFQQWVERNGWYAQNSEMRDFADALGTAYARNNPGKTPIEVLSHVERKVKQAYNLGTNPNRERPSTVEAGTGTRKASKQTVTDNDVELTDTERKVMQTFISQGLLTEAEYKKQLKAMR